ncbi:MAG: mscL [Actinomycetia bacterium]|nr:mscL [Actinomycetes bacterium]
MLRDFKAFILRGNVVDLAIGVAIGAAFALVVKAFTENIVTPLLAIPGSQSNFKAYTFTLFGSTFGYGEVLNAIIQFVMTAAVLFFLVVVPVNKLMARRKTEPDVEATTRDCEHCRSSIPRAATVCAFCTRDVVPA